MHKISYLHCMSRIPITGAILQMSWSFRKSLWNQNHNDCTIRRYDVGGFIGIFWINFAGVWGDFRVIYARKMWLLFWCHWCWWNNSMHWGAWGKWWKLMQREKIARVIRRISTVGIITKQRGNWSFIKYGKEGMRQLNKYGHCFNCQHCMGFCIGICLFHWDLSCNNQNT